MSFTPSRLIYASCLFVLAGCGNLGGPSSTDLLSRYPTPIYSLTGEILNGGPLGQPRCEAAQESWLNRVDTDHDGLLELAELQDEARRLFAQMDLNKDGFITADELAVYRAAFQNPDQPPGMEIDPKAPKGTHRLPIHPHGSQPDPVLSADSNLDFQVTLDEFLALQKDNIARYDKNHDHKLDAGELQQLCRERERSATPSTR